jgi:uncharacterized repeat protein (TIGR01451 family)
MVTKNGDEINWVITVKNDGPFDNTGVYAQDTIPPGLAYKTWSAEKGDFNMSNGKWTVGNVPVGKSYKLTITYKVTDITLATEESGVFGFYNSAQVFGDNIDPNSINNTVDNFVEITTCPPAAGAVGDPASCLCGSVAINDTPCSHGTTEYRLTVGSKVNLHADFDIETDGSYNAMGMVLNPYEDASFTYSIWCIVGGDEFQTSGPATVVIPALWPASFTDSLVDNGDGTMTHTALDGTVTTFNKGWTTIDEDSGTGDLIIGYPDGTTKTIEISNLLNPGQTVFPSVITSNIAITNLTLRNFTKINDSGGANISIVIPDPATLGLDTDRTFTWTFKRVNAWDSGQITITPDNLKKIDGLASITFPNNDFVSITLWTDGVNYFRS